MGQDILTKKEEKEVRALRWLILYFRIVRDIFFILVLFFPVYGIGGSIAFKMHHKIPGGLLMLATEPFYIVLLGLLIMSWALYVYLDRISKIIKKLKKSGT